MGGFTAHIKWTGSTKISTLLDVTGEMCSVVVVCNALRCGAVGTVWSVLCGAVFC